MKFGTLVLISVALAFPHPQKVSRSNGHHKSAESYDEYRVSHSQHQHPPSQRYDKTSGGKKNCQAKTAADKAAIDKAKADKAAADKAAADKAAAEKAAADKAAADKAAAEKAAADKAKADKAAADKAAAEKAAAEKAAADKAAADALAGVMPTINPALKAVEIRTCSTPGMFAMTFDDGPSKNIPALLAKLEELNVKATFFVNAQNFADLTNPTGPDALRLKSIFDSKHQVGTHTFKHEDLTIATPDADGKVRSLQATIWDTLRKNDNAIKAIIGKRPSHLRPPFLSTSDEMLTAAGSFGYKVIQTNLDTKDFEHNGKVDEVQLNQAQIAPIFATADAKKHSFISLNHDFTSKIVESTDKMVKEFKTKGFKFVTVAECIGDVTGGYRK